MKSVNIELPSGEQEDVAIEGLTDWIVNIMEVGQFLGLEFPIALQLTPIDEVERKPRPPRAVPNGKRKKKRTPIDKTELKKAMEREGDKFSATAYAKKIGASQTGVGTAVRNIRAGRYDK